MEKQYLVVYDIADPKRLNKVAAILLDYGERVQKSVFELTLHAETLKILRGRLQRVINPEEDGIKIFALCLECHARMLALGSHRERRPLGPWAIL